MWLPRRVETFFDKIELCLGAIQEAIKEKNAAANNADETAYVKRSDISRITAVVVHPDEEREAAHTDRKQTHAEQQEIIASQNKMAKWTRNACYAAILYGLIAAVQDYFTWKSMNAAIAANGTAQTALKQARDQFEYLQSARLVDFIQFTPGWKIETPDGAPPPGPNSNAQPPAVSFEIRNIGDGDATKVRYIYQVVEKQIDSEKVICNVTSEERIEVGRTLLPMSKGNAIARPFEPSPFADQRSISLDISKMSIPKLRETRAFLEIAGEYSYFDGFKDRLNNRFCYRMVGFAGKQTDLPYSEFLTAECGNFSTIYRSVINQRKSELDQFKTNKAAHP